MEQKPQAFRRGSPPWVPLLTSHVRVTWAPTTGAPTNISCLWGLFATINEPVLFHSYYLKSRVPEFTFFPSYGKNTRNL